ncbi:aldehyde reductase II [Aureobasidium sp. EXF-10727]|nr:aldehyde reductase II [Aureobasidium sp. EXF-10727]KAI4729825.1 aldehyde reductase II [Aureobasidium sp. EXF-10728]
MSSTTTIPVPASAVLKPGSLILITGVTGYIGAHIADQLLHRGYKVRGVVRKPADWLTKLFDSRHGKGNFETFFVADLTDEEALVEAMQGVSGVIHVASDVSFSPDPNIVIPIAVNLATTALKAAARTPSVQRFVLTSSAVAASAYAANTPRTVTASSWSDSYIAEAKQPGPYTPDRGLSTYGASKALAEQAIWEWSKQNASSNLTVNTVLPDFNLGLPVSPEHQGWPSSAGFAVALFNGDVATGRMLPPQYYIAVQDTALLHIAALLHPSVQSQRVFGFAEPKTANAILKGFKELYPDREFADEDPEEGEDLAVIEEKDAAEELLRWVAGKGWTRMRESLKEIGDYLIET